MKPIRWRTGIAGSLVLGLLPGAQAQEWSFGPKVNLGLSAQKSVGDEVIIDGNRISTTNSGDAVGSSVGAFARYDRPRWYAQAEAGRGKCSLTNTIISGPGSSFATYPRATRTDFRLIAGVKPLPWLRLSAGLVGALNTWRQSDYTSSIQSLRNSIQQFPDRYAQYEPEIVQYEVADALQKSYKKVNLEGQLGLGVDIGGLTVDLTYNNGLMPVLNGVNYKQQPYALRQSYSYVSLGVGYKLFPLTSHLLAPRNNRAYQRIQQDIPFYRNEFLVSLGQTTDDIGSSLVYENRYTRYLNRRLGVLVGLNFSHSFPSVNDNYGSVPISNQVTLLTGIRLLPLYSRRHTIGLSLGPLLTYSDGLRASSGTVRTVNGQDFRYLNLTRDAASRGLSAGWHATADYHFAITDRLIAGPWLRIVGHSEPDYGTFGIQAGYRF